MYYLAIDIGASSGRHILGKLENGKLELTEIYRFENGYEKQDILFVGDDFGDGGGDSHIRIFGLDYVEITDYTTLKDKLAKYL